MQKLNEEFDSILKYRLLTGETYVRYSILQHLKKYVLFQNLEHSFQIKIAIYIWQAIKNGNENLDKIRVDSLFSQETNYEAYSLILISKALIEKGKWSPANLDKIYNAISDYRDEKCISYNYRNKSHVVYGKMLIRYTNKVLNMNLDIIETKVDIKMNNSPSEIFDIIESLLTILFSRANLYNLTPLIFLAEYIGG